MGQTIFLKPQSEAAAEAEKDEGAPAGENVLRLAAEGGEPRRLGKLSPPQRDESETREDFRALKRHVLMRAEAADGAQKDARTLLVTSAGPGDGKTTVALGLALSFLFERERRVVLIDADLRTQELSRRMGLEDAPGLLDFLDDRRVALEEIVHPTNLPGVWAIASGRPRANAPELVAGARLQMLLAELRQGDGESLVVIDTGSVLSCSETTMLARCAGQILFVVAQGASRRADIDEGLAILHRDAGPLDENRVAIVFNKADRSHSPVRYARPR